MLLVSSGVSWRWGNGATPVIQLLGSVYWGQGGGRNDEKNGLLFQAVAEVMEYVIGEAGQVGEGGVSGDIVVQRGDGDEVVLCGPDVGAGLGGPVGTGAVDPVVEASGIDAFVDYLGVGAVGESGDPEALELGEGFVGDVDVNEGPGREEAIPGLEGPRR